MWVSDDGKEIKVVGSIEELEKLSGETITDLHRASRPEAEKSFSAAYCALPWFSTCCT